MFLHARGTFEVTLNAVPPEVTDAPGLNRMTMDKHLHGDLEGTSRGQMLSMSSGVQGSAGYVAMERVTGTVHGRRGSFVLQHSGTMTRGTGELAVTVVPDSGTDELTGVSGRFSISIVDKRHLYDFEYMLPDHS